MKNYIFSEYKVINKNEYGIVKTTNKGSSKIIVLNNTPAERELLYQYEKVIETKNSSSHYELYKVTSDNKKNSASGAHGGTDVLYIRKGTGSSYNTINKMVYGKGIYNENAHTFNVDSLLYTFDLVNRKLICYNLQSNTVKDILFQMKKVKNPQVVFDVVSKKFYQPVFEFGRLIMYQINPTTGAVTEVLIVKGFQFEKRVKINNGFVYFSSNSSLYQVPLK